MGAIMNPWPMKPLDRPEALDLVDADPPPERHPARGRRAPPTGARILTTPSDRAELDEGARVERRKRRSEPCVEALGDALVADAADQLAAHRLREVEAVREIGARAALSHGLSGSLAQISWR